MIILTGSFILAQFRPTPTAFPPLVSLSRLTFLNFSRCTKGNVGRFPSIFQTEIIYAIDICVKYNLNRGHIGDGHYVGWSGSHPGIKFSCHRSRMVREYRQRLNLLEISNFVTLHKVPGHIGVQGNVKADELARKGASTFPPMVVPE